MSDQSDEYTDIFAHVEVSDFARDSSAALASYTAPPTFDEFVSRHFQAAEVAFVASDGRLNPTAWVTRVGYPDALERVYVPDDDETMGQFVARIAREAKAFNDTAVFFVLRTEVGVEYKPDAEIGEAEMLVGERGLLGAETTDALFWFAEYDGRQDMGRPNGQWHERRSGISTIVDNRLDRHISSGGNQKAKLFESILGD